MKSLNKYKQALYYKELGHIVHGLEKRLHHFKARKFKYLSALTNYKLKQEFSQVNADKSTLTNELKTVFGSFNSYTVSESLKSKLINDANAICNHNFSMLGATVVFGEKIDWHSDFKSGYTWRPGTFYLDYIQVDLTNNADVKIPRELSRSHHLLILGQAYLLTKDERYTTEFINQIQDWIYENPLMFSINWGCTMDVALRAANWVFALAMFVDSPKITNAFLQTVLLSLYKHGWFIENNLEKSFKYNSNHYDGDIGGLLFLGLLFSKTKRGDHWLKFSKYALFDEIRKQIYPSGMELEKSTYYNRLVLEIFSYSIFLLKRNNYKIPADIEARIHSMFIFIHELALPNNHLPVFGDNDSSRFLPFDTIYRTDIQYITDIGYAYFGDEIFKNAYQAASSEVFFLLEANQKIEYKALNKYTFEQLNKSKIFADVGIVKLCFSDAVLLINNSSPGRFIDDPFAGGSHAHADLLSFVLGVDEIPLFVDPGSYVYTSDYKSRNLFRSTTFHNTVNINAQSQFKIIDQELFYFNSKAEVLNVLFYDDTKKLIYEGLHDAYSYLGKNCIHKRRIEIHKAEQTVYVFDTIEHADNDTINIHFHLHPEIAVTQQSDTFELYYNGNKKATVSFESKENFKTQIANSFYSPSYGLKQNTSAIDVYYKSGESSTVCTKIVIL